MCLTTKPSRSEKKKDFIDKIIIEKKYGVAYRVGYKILNRTYSHRLAPPIQTNGSSLKLNRWIHRDETSFLRSGEQLWFDIGKYPYESGYHIYIDEDEAKRMLHKYYRRKCACPTLRKVYFKEVTAYGYERRTGGVFCDEFINRIVVARQIFIPSLKNPKP